MGKSIYKSDEGRRAMAHWYEHFVARLGTEVEFVQVETRFGQTNVLVTGPKDAPPLWCFHGAMASAPAALAQVPELARRFRIYFPDTVGQPGRSTEMRLDWQGLEHGHWVVDVLDGLGVSSIRAIGVSLGGYVLLRAAQVAPERVERAVFWVPGGLIKPSWKPMFGLIGAGLAYALFPSRARLERILSRTFTDMDDDYVSFFGDSLKHVHPDRRFPNTLPDGALEGWQGRVMLVTHQHDTVFPAEALKARAKAMFNHLEVSRHMEGWAHMPPFAKGALDDLVDEMERFLTSPSGDDLNQ